MRVVCLLDLWLPNSPDLNPLDYRICSVMQEYLSILFKDVVNKVAYCTYYWY